MGNALSEGAKCPVDHGKSVSAAAPPPECPMHAGSGASTTSAPAPAAVSAASPPPECPMHANGGASAGSAAQTPASGSKARGTVYNVYAQPIDPKNQMPATANQQPSAGQEKPLSTERVQSSIPKGGTESTWLYPSPQMFWNALVRKNKAENVEEDDMDVVVKIHNEMNERAWRRLMEWEELHKGEHLEGEPSLRRFMGKPFDLSIKAQLKAKLGYGFPFDRHDWYVDRAGKEVRYVIDYYFTPDKDADVAGGPVGEPPLVPHYTKSIHVDVRPAPDTATAVVDRLRRFPERAWEALWKPKFKAEGLDPAGAPLEAAAFALSAPSGNSVAHGSAATPAAGAGAGAPAGPVPITPSPAGPQRVAAALPGEGEDDLFERMIKQCSPFLDQMMGEEDDAKRDVLNIKYNYCAAKLVCPQQAAAYLAVMEGGAAAAPAGKSFEQAQVEARAAMTDCIFARFKERKSKREAAAAVSAAAATGGAGAGGAALK